MAMSLRLVMVLLILLLMSGCVTRGNKAGAPYYGLQPGSVLSLKQPLVLLPREVRVRIQDGRAVAFAAMDQYRPSCSFEVRNLIPEAQTIAPGEFAISRIEQGQSPIVSLKPIQVAAWGRWSGLSVWGEGAPHVARYFHFWFNVPQQPNLLRLTCYGGIADLPEARLPNINQIHAVLGDIARIR